MESCVEQYFMNGRFPNLTLSPFFLQLAPSYLAVDNRHPDTFQLVDNCHPTTDTVFYIDSNSNDQSLNTR